MSMNRSAALILAALFLFPGWALAQGGVLQSGSVIPGNVACWAANGIILDCGSSAGPFIAQTDGAGTGTILTTPTFESPNTALGGFTMTSGNVWFDTCPVSNCPPVPGAGGGGPVLSKAWLWGQTTQGDSLSEWLAVDGLYVGTGANNGQKVTRYIGAMQGPGAGSAWTLNTDIVRGACPGGDNSLYGQPGSGTPFGEGSCATAPGSIGVANSTIGFELDLTNWDADAAPGGAFVVGMFINTLSSYSSLAGIYYGAYPGQAVASWHNGIFFAGPSNGSPRTVSDNTVYDVSGSATGHFLGGIHSLAGYRDESTGERSIHLVGTKSVGDIDSNSASPAMLVNSGVHALGTFVDTSTSPIVFSIAGTHSAEVFNDTSTSPASLNLGGTYSLTAITTQNSTATNAMLIKEGQNVCFAGVDACFKHTGGKLYYVVGGVNMFSVADGSGNAIFKGTVTQSSTP